MPALASAAWSGREVPNNYGSLGPVRITAPEGCIVNAPRPAAVTVRHVIGQMLPDVVLGCLGQAVPGSVPAEGQLQRCGTHPCWVATA